MNLVFIHGRSQGHRSEQAIREEWLGGLQAGFAAAGVDPPSLEPTFVPFYGAKLDELTAALKSSVVGVIERGESTEGVPFDPFMASIAERIADRAGVDRGQALDEASLTVVERGPERWEGVQALFRAALKKFPWLGDVGAALIFEDVEAYLTRPHITKAIHEIVQEPLSQGPSVVVAHSLGTVVAYWILAEILPDAKVSLLITAGSPLGIDVVKDRLPSPLKFPASVGHWLNVTDEEDFIALYSRLDRNTFLGDIENISDLENGDNPHAISRYLADPIVARRIAKALS